MTIEFPCKHCGRRFRVDGAFAGKTTRCKGCGQPITIPLPREPARTPNEPTTRAKEARTNSNMDDLYGLADETAEEEEGEEEEEDDEDDSPQGVAARDSEGSRPLSPGQRQGILFGTIGAAILLFAVAAFAPAPGWTLRLMLCAMVVALPIAGYHMSRDRTSPAARKREREKWEEGREMREEEAFRMRVLGVMMGILGGLAFLVSIVGVQTRGAGAIGVLAMLVCGMVATAGIAISVNGRTAAIAANLMRHLLTIVVAFSGFVIVASIAAMIRFALLAR